MTKTYNVDYFEDRKLKYEKNHGIFIHEYMFTEFSNRILGQCNVALNNLQRQLDLEIERAKAEERRLDEKIDAETERALTAEHGLETKIIDETNRAQDAENSLSDKIDNSAINIDYVKSHTSRGESLVREYDPTNITNANELLVKLFASVVFSEGFPQLYLDREGRLVYQEEQGSLLGAYTQSLNALQNITDYIADGFQRIFKHNSTVDSSNPYKNEQLFRILLDLINKLDQINNTIYPYMDRVAETNNLTVNLPNDASKNLPDSLHETYSAISSTLSQINNNLTDLSNRVSALEPQTRKD